jgi:hypothetical protein
MLYGGSDIQLFRKNSEAVRRQRQGPPPTLSTDLTIQADPISRRGCATNVRSISLHDATATARSAANRFGVTPIQPAIGTR